MFSSTRALTRRLGLAIGGFAAAAILGVAPARAAGALPPGQTGAARIAGFGLDRAELRQRQSAALDQFVAAYPKLSCGWYARGLFKVEDGQTGTALDDFQRGNAAPDDTYPPAFPVQFVLANYRYGTAEYHPDAMLQVLDNTPASPLGSDVAAALVLRAADEYSPWLSLSALSPDVLSRPRQVLDVPQSGTLRAVIVLHKALARMALMPAGGWEPAVDFARSDNALLAEAAFRLRQQLPDAQYKTLTDAEWAAQADLDRAYAPAGFTSSDDGGTAGLAPAVLRELEAEGVDVEQIAGEKLHPFPADVFGPEPDTGQPCLETDLVSRLALETNALREGPGVRWDLRLHGARLRLRLAQSMALRMALQAAARDCFGRACLLQDDEFAYGPLPVSADR
jgi:hypothetical protein